MRHENRGVRKICGCARSKWTKCDHGWHFNFKWKDKHYRLSLDKQLGRHIDSKTEAEDEAAKIRIAIKAGAFGVAAPALDQLTITQLLDNYKERYVDVERKDSLSNVTYQLGTIKKLEIKRLDGCTLAFGDWRVADVTTDTIERFKEARRTRGVVATNRDLSLLRAAFNWAIRMKLVKETPFKLGTETVVKLLKEHARSRRLTSDEATKLLAACTPHLRGIVEAALETGMRKSEILSLQWQQVEGMKIDKDKAITWEPKSELFLPFAKTKTKRDRRIPISTRLKSLLEMRRFDPAGHPHAADCYVFGTEIGSRLLGFSRTWRTAVLKAHGHTPVYTDTANLTPECRAALKSIGLHFHDLRREAGSRWMDGGVPIATIQRWLGHSNVSQTSTYLAGTEQSEHDAMNRYEAQQALLQQLATEGEKRGQKRARTTAKRDRKLNKTAVNSNPTVM